MMNYKNALLILLSATLMLTGLSDVSKCYSQPVFQWVATYNGTANHLDYGRALFVDDSGNAYIAGTVTNSGSGKDIAVIRFNNSGIQQWVAEYNGDANGDDWGYGLAVDRNGNVYVTGFTTTLSTGKDFVTVKFDSAGVQQWARQYNGSADLDDVASHIAVDISDNVIITGISKGTGTADDYATVKYNPSGDLLWAVRYNGPGNGIDDARTIASDSRGNIYVSGGSTGQGSDYDFATIKYDSAGNEKWVARYNGPGNQYDLVYYQGSLVVDSLFNVYITGYSTGNDSTLDYATIKYDSSGTQLWVSRFSAQGNGTDYANAIHIDDSLNVYVTGAGFMAGNNLDIATVKYDPNGTELWVAYYNGTAGDWDEGYGVTTDDSLNVYVVGRSPGITTGADFVMLKYSPSGNLIWEERYLNSGYDWPFAIKLSAENCIYLGGSLGTNISDMAVIKYCQDPVGYKDFFVKDIINVEVYPNPGKGIFTVETTLESGFELSVFNLHGKEVFQSHFSGKTEKINLSFLHAGLYLFRVHSDNDLITRKVIVLE